eukprot:gene46063-49146_t
MAREERKIRSDPGAAASSVVQQVFHKGHRSRDSNS